MKNRPPACTSTVSCTESEQPSHTASKSQHGLFTRVHVSLCHTAHRFYDVAQVIIQALIAGHAHGRMQGFTRYKCQCGALYMVGECGEAVQEGTCPECQQQIGGLRYADRNNKKVDQSPLVRSLASSPGYFPHPPSRDLHSAARKMSPLCFRTLHFLLHSALLTPMFDGRRPRVLHNFEKILEHLKADWYVVSRILHCSPAGFLMEVAGATAAITWVSGRRLNSDVGGCQN